ncbi:MAG TPA: amidase [Intrasporangium sp.]|uniref:amidase n=1 Tax=Intrasporangium sp. TaxID=1925024 RepID=UPI002D7A11F4|nr:amidase [Intrasporangium sp.]HET7396922.1 amidase [Intrasporangium sp.]
MPGTSRGLARLGATELVAAYERGELSPVEVTAAVTAVIEAREPVLNALWATDLDAAMDAARASEARWRAGRPLGPIDGVPVTVKENLARAGVPMQSGCAGVSPTVPQRDSPVVERITEAGGLILGSTVMPDWGMLSSGVSSLHGITRSPWDPALTTGGSSSGAGAAAAAGYGPLHVGTDIGGSIRLPGTWLGLTTLKPSAGRVPLDAPYLGRAAGPMARSARDAALLLAVISRPDVRDWTSLPPETIDFALQDCHVSGLRVGLQLDAGCGLTLDPEVRAAVERAAEVFAAGGARVEPVAPFIDEDMLTSLDLFWRVRSWVDYEALAPDARQRVLPFVARWCQAGQHVSGPEVMRCYSRILSLQQATVAATEPYDLVLSPVAPMAAFPAEWPMPFGDRDLGMAHIGFTAPYNMSGQPAATTNCGFTPDGRTIGVQISGRRFNDVGVLRATQWFEEHREPALAPVWPIVQPHQVEERAGRG